MKKTNKTTAVKSQQTAPTLKLDVTALEAQTGAAAKEEKKTAPVLKVVEPEKTEEKEAAKTVETKTAETKTAAKAPAKKAAAKPAEKPELKPELFIQYGGNEVQANDLVEQVKQIYVADGHRASSIKSLQLYFKPEDNAVYYVVNEKLKGKIDLF